MRHFFIIAILICTAVYGTSVLGTVIYHQTMTPDWLKNHASYISSASTSTPKQLTFNPISVKQAALLKVPLIPSDEYEDSAPLIVEIVVANDVSIGNSADSTIRYGVSDGKKFVGLQTVGKKLYVSQAPCFGVQGVSGATLSALRWSDITPKPRDSFYPGRFIITLKLNESWGLCYTAHDRGFMKIVEFNNRLMLSKGLALEVYKGVNNGDKVGIKSIMVTIFEDDSASLSATTRKTCFVKPDL